MEFLTTLSKTPGGHYIPIEEKIALKIHETMGKRVICEANEYRFHCAVQRSNRLGYYIMASKATLKKIQAAAGDEILVKIEKDRTKYQSEMPEELRAVLDTDPEALVIFEGLTPGKKRSIMHLVNSAKQVDTRINRGLKIAENLKLGRTKPQDFLK